MREWRRGGALGNPEVAAGIERFSMPVRHAEAGGIRMPMREPIAKRVQRGLVEAPTATEVRDRDAEVIQHASFLLDEMA
jgi:hypothetical protein